MFTQDLWTPLSTHSPPFNPYQNCGLIYLPHEPIIEAKMPENTDTVAAALIGK